MKTSILAALTAGFVLLSTLAFASEGESVMLKYVPADQAQEAVQKDLGNQAAAAVQKVTLRDNSLTLDPKHADFAKVRGFLEKLDKPQEVVHVAAVITRQIEATAQEPARREVVARPVVIAPAGKRVIIQIPEGKGAAEVELTITPIPKK